ncbi:hypothetical protein GJ496_004891 [Pomphorhynchus laevis]|nr:hypothetical protein GJ496_004891 [Pomphorhynchus laevis]
MGTLVSNMFIQLPAATVGDSITVHSDSVASLTPLILTTCHYRFPSEFRRPFVKKLYDEYKKAGKEDCLNQAKQDELAIASKATSSNAYRNNIAQIVIIIYQTIKPELKCDTLNQNRRIKVTDLSEAELYKLLLKYVLTEEDLKRHGFPYPGETSNEILIHRNPYWFSKISESSSDPCIRCCDRCSKEFKVDTNELPIKGDKCIYHWGKCRVSYEKGRESSKRYFCCGESEDMLGCTSAEVHVVRANEFSKDMMRGFVYSIPKSLESPNASAGIFALDCEMCYTTKGLEVAHISVIDHKLCVVYQSYIRPDNPIIDHNTRFSGITDSNLIGVTTSLSDVQAALNKLISNKSILIGHGLHNDLIGIKLIHSVIIDTSVLFPHRNGYPYKRSLRDLAREKINKIIQNNADGHSSTEDAIACLQLVFYKLQSDLSFSHSALFESS